jgi:hypothetical protein
VLNWPMKISSTRSGTPLGSSVGKAQLITTWGGGLETGIPDLNPARAARRKLLRYKKWHEVKVLDRLVCGAIWHHGREGSRRDCKHCGEPATAWHRGWGCISFKDHPDKLVRDTNELKSLFKSGRGSRGMGVSVEPGHHPWHTHQTGRRAPKDR